MSKKEEPDWKFIFWFSVIIYVSLWVIKIELDKRKEKQAERTEQSAGYVPLSTAPTPIRIDISKWNEAPSGRPALPAAPESTSHNKLDADDFVQPLYEPIPSQYDDSEDIEWYKEDIRRQLDQRSKKNEKERKEKGWNDYLEV